MVTVKGITAGTFTPPGAEVLISDQTFTDTGGGAGSPRTYDVTAPAIGYSNVRIVRDVSVSDWLGFGRLSYNAAPVTANPATYTHVTPGGFWWVNQVSGVDVNVPIGSTMLYDPQLTSNPNVSTYFDGTNLLRISCSNAAAGSVMRIRQYGIPPGAQLSIPKPVIASSGDIVVCYLLAQSQYGPTMGNNLTALDRQTTNIDSVGGSSCKTFPLGSLPTDWETVTFNDTAWADSVSETASNSTEYTSVPSTGWITETTKNGNLGAGVTAAWLFRRRFTLPIGDIISATLTLTVDDAFSSNHLYLNGHLLEPQLRSGTAPIPGSGIAVLDLSWLNTGGADNVLAGHVTSTGLETAVSFRLQVIQAGPGEPMLRNTGPTGFRSGDGNMAPIATRTWWAETNHDAGFTSWKATATGLNPYPDFWPRLSTFGVGSSTPNGYGAFGQTFLAIPRIVQGSEPDPYVFNLEGGSMLDPNVYTIHGWAVCYSSADLTSATVNGSGRAEILTITAPSTLAHSVQAAVQLDGAGTYPTSPDHLAFFLQGYAGLQSYGGTTVLSTVLSCSTGARALSLWNGTGNNLPPASWEQPAFLDTGWVFAVDVTNTHSPPPTPWVIPGALAIWSQPLSASNTEQALFRERFTLPASTGVISAQATVMANDDCDGVWINGNFLTGSIDNNNVGGPLYIVNIPLAYLVFGSSSNLFAIKARNTFDAPTGGTPSGDSISYKVEITTALTGVDTIHGYSRDAPPASDEPATIVVAERELQGLWAYNREIGYWHAGTLTGPSQHHVASPAFTPPGLFYRNPSATLPGTLTYGIIIGFWVKDIPPAVALPNWVGIIG